MANNSLPPGHPVPASITRLTALWALSESGLGGFMHALKIPFTGFFLGGFAVVIIVLIAYHAQHTFRAVMQATLLVVLVKATVSPHSPPMAYIAVTFQGLAGALLLQLPAKRAAAVLFGMIALLESAVQKFLVMTLIFGKSVWEALDLFFKGILKDLYLDPDFSFSFWLITLYTAVYTVWGLLLGWWASSLPASMLLKKDDVLLRYRELYAETSTPTTSAKKKRKMSRLAGIFFMLLFVCTVFLVQGNTYKAWFAILRTVAALVALFFLINPLVKWAIAYWAGKRQQSDRHRLASITDQLPELRNYLSPALLLARQQHRGFAVYPSFVRNLIILALYNRKGDE